MAKNELNTTESAVSAQNPRLLPNWVKVTTVAAASALAGGLAAAWYYRKTLNDLRAAEETAGVPDFGISEEIDGEHIDLDT